MFVKNCNQMPFDLPKQDTANICRFVLQLHIIVTNNLLFWLITQWTWCNIVRSNLYTMAAYILPLMRKRNSTKSPLKMSKVCSQFGDVVSVLEKMWRQFSDEVIIQIPVEM